MRAMVLSKVGQPLVMEQLPVPTPAPLEIRIRIQACGICRTDLHVVDGELPDPKLPLIPGHQIVGLVESVGTAVNSIHVGDIVGVPWLGNSCGECSYCVANSENLCDHAVYTGYQRSGGFAEYCTADSRYVIPLPPDGHATQMAPLLCAGLIGYRALSKLPKHFKKVGFYGFGSSAHILCQVATQQKQKIYAFTSPGDQKTQDFALSCGAVWAGDSDQAGPDLLDGAIIFAPVGELVPAALAQVRKGGIVVCAGIHMSDIPSFPYALLWGERHLCSVANLTREDGREFFKKARELTIQMQVTSYTLENTNEALSDLKAGRVNGALVIEIS